MLSWVARRAVILLPLLAFLSLPSPAAAQETLRVFAAASMKNALDAIASDYTRLTGTKMSLSYGASSALARQIEQGAPADLFISADEDWMDYLAARNLIISTTRRPLVGNRLVLIAPAQSPAAVTLSPDARLVDLLGRDGRLALADPRAVPAGKYARMALEKLKLWPQIESRLAPAENVRIALGMVARGEAPLGIVYASDQLAEPMTRVVAIFPEDSHAPITYPVAALASGQQQAAAAFLVHLGSAGARDILRGAGFIVPATTGRGS